MFDELIEGLEMDCSGRKAVKVFALVLVLFAQRANSGSREDIARCYGRSWSCHEFRFDTTFYLSLATKKFAEIKCTPGYNCRVGRPEIFAITSHSRETKGRKFVLVYYATEYGGVNYALCNHDKTQRRCGVGSSVDRVNTKILGYFFTGLGGS